MDQYQIAVVVGSLRRDSWNRRLAGAVARLGPPEFAFTQVRIDDLPLYNQDEDPNPSPPVRRFKSEIARAQGLLFVTPEYNRGIPGVLKNAIDHGTRPPGQNSWSGKPAGLMGASPGAIGTAVAQLQLRALLSYLNVITLGQPEVYIQAKESLFDETGAIAIEGTRTFLQGWMDRYTAWVKRHAG